MDNLKPAEWIEDIAKEQIVKKAEDSIAKKVYNIITGQDFADWYEGEFMNHITGEEGAKTRAQIMERIEQFLKYN